MYNYYSGIYELREELENDLVKLWNESIQKLDFQKNFENPQQIFDILTEIINSNLELYSNLIKLDAKSYIIRKLVESMTELVKNELEKSKVAFQGSKKLEIAAQFVTSGILSVYQHWFNSDRNVPLEELSKEIGVIVLYGIKSLER